MAKALDIITGSMRLIGAVASGEVPTPEESADALAVMNDILESWSIERLTVYVQLEQTFAVAAGVDTYTLGPGATWDGARPVQIMAATMTTGGLAEPVDVVGPAKWAGITSGRLSCVRPVTINYLPTYPVGSVRMFPAPISDGVLTITSAQPFAPVTSLAQELLFPPGYRRALRYALAVALGPEFGTPIRPDLVSSATDSKADIRRANQEPPPELDVTLPGAGLGHAGDLFGIVRGASSADGLSLGDGILTLE